MVPYADFNLLKFPDYDQAMEKIGCLTTLSDSKDLDKYPVDKRVRLACDNKKKEETWLR